MKILENLQSILFYLILFSLYDGVKSMKDGQEAGKGNVLESSKLMEQKMQSPTKPLIAPRTPPGFPAIPRYPKRKVQKSWKTEKVSRPQIIENPSKESKRIQILKRGQTLEDLGQNKPLIIEPFSEKVQSEMHQTLNKEGKSGMENTGGEMSQKISQKNEGNVHLFGHNADGKQTALRKDGEMLRLEELRMPKNEKGKLEMKKDEAESGKKVAEKDVFERVEELKEIDQKEGKIDKETSTNISLHQNKPTFRAILMKGKEKGGSKLAEQEMMEKVEEEMPKTFKDILIGHQQKYEKKNVAESFPEEKADSLAGGNNQQTKKTDEKEKSHTKLESSTQKESTSAKQTEQNDGKILNTEVESNRQNLSISTNTKRRNDHVQSQGEKSEKMPLSNAEIEKMAKRQQEYFEQSRKAEMDFVARRQQKIDSQRTISMPMVTSLYHPHYPPMASEFGIYPLQTDIAGQHWPWPHQGVPYYHYNPSVNQITTGTGIGQFHPKKPLEFSKTNRQSQSKAADIPKRDRDELLEMKSEREERRKIQPNLPSSSAKQMLPRPIQLKINKKGTTVPKPPILSHDKKVPTIKYVPTEIKDPSLDPNKLINSKNAVSNLAELKRIPLEVPQTNEQSSSVNAEIANLPEKIKSTLNPKAAEFVMPFVKKSANSLKMPEKAKNLQEKETMIKLKGKMADKMDMEEFGNDIIEPELNKNMQKRGHGQQKMAHKMEEIKPTEIIDDVENEEIVFQPRQANKIDDKKEEEGEEIVFQPRQASKIDDKKEEEGEEIVFQPRQASKIDDNKEEEEEEIVFKPVIKQKDKSIQF